MIKLPYDFPLEPPRGEYSKKYFEEMVTLIQRHFELISTRVNMPPGDLSVDSLDVAGDLFVGADLGVVGSIACGGALFTGAEVVTADGVYEHGRGTAMGEWQDVSFNAANFTSDAGTWTVASGNVGFNRYTLIGKTMIWAVQINAATLTGAGTYLLIDFPVSVAQLYNSHCAIATDGVPVIVPALIMSVSGKLGIRQVTGASWANGSQNYVSFTATAELS
jgi:hypothetical protein